jgi:6-phosphogluconolactonase
MRLYIASPARPPIIATCTVNLETGEFSTPRPAAKGVSTGFLALHPSKPILYAAATEGGRRTPTGAVRAYEINRDTGMLKLLNQTSTADKGTTHLAVDRAGKAVVVCHYGGKGTSALALAGDGTVKEGVSQIVHTGSSVHPSRQKGPHPHGVAIHQGGRFVSVADLGTDHVEVFALSKDAKLSKASFWKAKPGAGPRHVSFHPNGKWLYCINEIDSTIAVLEFNADKGTLKEVQTISTLPEDFKGENTTAEVVVHPSGKFLYGSNRGHNSTAVFAIDPDTGTLTLVEHEPTQGDHPRFVGLDSTGKLYIAANMNSNNLVSFWIDPKTGALKPTGHKVTVARPMCVVFVK